MDIRPADSAQPIQRMPVSGTAKKDQGTGDVFSPQPGAAPQIAISFDEVKNMVTGSSGSTEDAIRQVQEMEKKVEASRAEMQELVDGGQLDVDTAKKILLGSAVDPHVDKEIVLDGTVSTKPVLRKDGSVVAGGNDEISMKYLAAHREDGSVIWRSDDLIDKNPACDKAGNFYFAKNHGTVSYSKDGARRWEFSRHHRAADYKEYDARHSADCSGSSGVPAIDESRGTLYFGEWYGKFFAVDKESGAVKWVRERPGMIGSCDPTLDREGNIFFHDDNGYVLSVKPDGSENWIVGVGCQKHYPRRSRTFDDENSKSWMKEVGLSRRSHKNKEKDGDHYAVGTRQILVGDAQKVVFGMTDGRLMALNHDTGDIEMFFDAVEPIYAPPLEAGDGKVVFATSEGHLFCVDTANPVEGKYGKEMKLLWDAKLEQYAAPELVDSSGKIYVTSEAGMRVYNPDGTIAWRTSIQPQTGIQLTDDGSVLISSLEKIMWLKPLNERVAALREKGMHSGSASGADPSAPQIEEDESTVNIDGVKLEKKK